MEFKSYAENLLHGLLSALGLGSQTNAPAGNSIPAFGRGSPALEIQSYFNQGQAPAAPVATNAPISQMPSMPQPTGRGQSFIYDPASGGYVDWATGNVFDRPYGDIIDNMKDATTPAQ